MSKNGRMLRASLARQVNVQIVILGVDDTAAAFLFPFSAAGKRKSPSRLEREAKIKYEAKSPAQFINNNGVAHKDLYTEQNL